MADVPAPLSQTSGLQVNGDIYGPDKGRIDAYDCVGTFRYSLLVKEDEAVDIFLDGKLVRHLVLKAGDTWNSSFPVSRPGRRCTLEIAPTHLVGTTAAHVPSRQLGSRHARFRTPDPPERPPAADSADAAGAVRVVLRDARRRLALRDRRHKRDRALLRAHVLQGHRAAADRARHRRRGRLDRRRVQRVHEQGVHGLLRQVRRRAPRRGARRDRRHAPQLEVRLRGDRPREGRDHRGDEHVLRHAAGLRRRRVRGAHLRRRPSARLGHHRPQGNRAGRDARHVHGLPRPLVQAVAHGRRRRRPDRRRSHRADRGAARRPRGRGDRLAASRPSPCRTVGA